MQTIQNIALKIITGCLTSTKLNICTVNQKQINYNSISLCLPLISFNSTRPFPSKALYNQPTVLSRNTKLTPASHFNNLFSQAPHPPPNIKMACSHRNGLMGTKQLPFQYIYKCQSTRHSLI